MTAPVPGRLVVAAVPIGNPEDASPRLRSALGTAPVVAAEDTRRVRALARRVGVTLTGRVLSYHDGNEDARTAELVDLISAGTEVLLVTDAGTPSVSDPGYRMVTAALAAGLPVSVLPGPSAVTAALVLSGLPTDRFCFEGFLPRRAAARRARLAELAADRRTLVLFEAPHRLAATLADLTTVFGGDRAAAACRELTKTYEEVRRATLAELARWALDRPRGEVTLVVAGAPATQAARGSDALARAVADRVASGSDRREAMAAVARAAGVPRRDVYAAVVASKGTSTEPKPERQRP